MAGSVLVVEDENTQQIIVSNLLEELGYHPIVTDNLEEAYSIIESFQLHFAIIDIYLPKKSGWELIKKIRAMDQSIGILIITGIPDKDSKQFQNYYNDFKFSDVKILFKPIIKNAFINTVTSFKKAVSTESSIENLSSKMWLDRIKHSHALENKDCLEYARNYIEVIKTSLSTCEELLISNEKESLHVLASSICMNDLCEYIENGGSQKIVVLSLLDNYMDFLNT